MFCRICQKRLYKNYKLSPQKAFCFQSNHFTNYWSQITTMKLWLSLLRNDHHCYFITNISLITVKPLHENRTVRHLVKQSVSVCWFPVKSGSQGVVFPNYRATEERYLTVLLDLLSKLDASKLFVHMFVEFLDFVFVYSSCDRM